MIPGRFSQPDMRCWDPNAQFFLGTYQEFIDAESAFEEIPQCGVHELPSSLQTDPIYMPVQETAAFESELIQYQPGSSPSPVVDVVVDAEEPLTSVGAERIGIFEEITHARCIDCDQVVDSRENSHNKSTCVLRKNYSCPQCSETFNFDQNLEVHKIVAHSSQESYVPGSECLFCSNKRKKKTFQRFFAYIAHMKSHAKPDQYFCPSCPEEFSHLALFQRHRRLAHSSANIEKTICGFSSELGYCPSCCSLISLDQVEKHRLLHHLHVRLRKTKRIPSWKRQIPATSQKTGTDDGSNGTIQAENENLTNSRRRIRKTHKCNECGKVFLRPSELKRHSTIHSASAEKWKCALCDNEYSHKSGLLAHEKAVHGDSQRAEVVCQICSQKFAKQSNLNRHIKKQHPIRIEKAVLDCPECSCVFSNHRTLTRHRRAVHDAAFPPFCCDVCNRTFLKETQMRRHMLSHKNNEAQKPFPCSRCHKSFNLKSTLKLHMDIHSRRDIDDPVLTNPKCPVCMKHLSSRNALRKHMTVHERNYECCVCFQKFSTLHRLDKHRCVPQTVLPEEVDEHLTELSATSRRQVVGDVRQPTKNYQCNICVNSFYSFRAYKEHCSQHQGLRPHLCWTCHKSFRTSELLELHKEVHSRSPIYCEYCPAILQGRNQYTQHIQSRHQLESGVEKHYGVDLTERTCGALSAQSFPELTGRELAEDLFRTRAQSVDRNEMETTGGELAIQDDRPVRCQVCSHLYDSVAHLVNHWTNCGFDRDHSFCVASCPLCGRSINGVAAGVEHIREFHAHAVAPKAVQEDEEERRDEDGVDDDEEEPNSTDGDESDRRSSRSHARKQHKCQTCPASFSKPSDLVRHIRVHTGERPFVCDVCQRAFRVVSALYAHRRTHRRKQAEHPCTVCGAEFFSKSSLALHLRIHSGEKPLKCRHCDDVFRTSSDRKQHEITWHGAPGSHVCRKSPCSHCDSARRRRSRLEKQRETSRTWSFMVDSGGGIETLRTLLPVKQLAAAPSDAVNVVQPDQFIETAAQFTSLPSIQIKPSAGSAFDQCAKQASVAPAQELEFFITARRISHVEYSVTFSKTKPKSIRAKVDTTVSLTASLLLDSASRNSSILVTLSDSQILSISCAGLVKALQNCDSVVMRARPANPSFPSTVELLAPQETAEFIRRCEVCEIDLHSKKASDAHFSSEDHETAQLTLPLPAAVHNAIDPSTLPPAAIPLQRKDERTDFTCKLCGRKFLDMEPLVAHIRLEHERDHPQGITRPAARTAPIH
ncbi:hypothetical protein Q1695_010479 [Nippostrongylus brasiliensis]|nr:hypothetical protein Q1695_010479 [Nippostrongylus brasiliensis]